MLGGTISNLVPNRPNGKTQTSQLFLIVVLEDRLNKSDIEKVVWKFWAMYQCILNVSLWNEWSKVTYSQEHGSPIVKALSFKSLNRISATIFGEFIQFEQDSKLSRPRTLWWEYLVFRWRQNLYFSFTYIFPLVLLFIS